MAYQKGEHIFPPELLEEIQKYMSGGLVYIPQKKTEKKEWGSCTGIKMELIQRNAKIKQQYLNGDSMESLADQYFLAVETIKRIVYKKCL